MTRLKILHHPDPRLRTKATPVDTFDSQLAEFAKNMLETMYAAPGIGLAATIFAQLQASDFACSLVLTQPDRPRGRGRALSPNAVKVAASAYGLPILQPTSLRQ